MRKGRELSTHLMQQTGQWRSKEVRRSDLYWTASLGLSENFCLPCPPSMNAFPLPYALGRGLRENTLKAWDAPSGKGEIHELASDPHLKMRDQRATLPPKANCKSNFFPQPSCPCHRGHLETWSTKKRVEDESRVRIEWRVHPFSLAHFWAWVRPRLAKERV